MEVTTTKTTMVATNNADMEKEGMGEGSFQPSLPTMPNQMDTPIKTIIPSLTEFIMGRSRRPVAYLFIQLVECGKEESE